MCLSRSFRAGERVPGDQARANSVLLDDLLPDQQFEGIVPEQNHR
jgi:hypothetical protein